MLVQNAGVIFIYIFFLCRFRIDTVPTVHLGLLGNELEGFDISLVYAILKEDLPTIGLVFLPNSGFVLVYLLFFKLLVYIYRTVVYLPVSFFTCLFVPVEFSTHQFVGTSFFTQLGCCIQLAYPAPWLIPD